MNEEFNHSKMMRALNWSYDKAINGLPGLETAEEMANDYLKGNGDLIDKVNSLIRWQNSKCATSGFISGLGGIFTLPVAIPANLTSVLYVQLRMIAAIAYMGDNDVRDDRVKTLTYICLTGSGATDTIKDTGIQLGTKLSIKAIEKISGETLTKINQKVGFRLLTKFGEKGVINLGKAVPIVGGLIGATFDAVSTNTIGNIARKTFIEIA
jgi:hypothetical protein